MNIITRKEALSQGLIHYFTGKPCKHGHLSRRQTASCNCQECVNESVRKWARRNPEVVAAKNRQHYQENREHHQRLHADWRSRNRETRYEINRRWYRQNRDRWRVYEANRRARLSQVLDLTPAQMAQIRAIYQLRATLTRETGVPYEVHHEHWLSKGGLHVPENLWVLTREEHRERHRTRQARLP